VSGDALNGEEAARLCACGCGIEVSIAKRTDSRRGQVKGQPLRYVPGHSPPRRGSANALAKLSEDDVRRIFDLRAEGRTQASIAAVFGVARQNIGRILRGGGWPHVKRPGMNRSADGVNTSTDGGD